MHQDLEYLVLSEEQIADKVKETAIWLDDKFASATVPPLAICVLKGGVFFFCDVVRAMKTPVQPEFMTVSSYGNASISSGKLKIIMDLNIPVDGRDVILIEDIIDSGNTVFRLKELIIERRAKSFTTVTLLDKPVRRTLPVKADYTCFEVGNEFIVGYGLDYAENYRNLPYIGVLKRKIYEN